MTVRLYVERGGCYVAVEIDPELVDRPDTLRRLLAKAEYAFRKAGV